MIKALKDTMVYPRGRVVPHAMQHARTPCRKPVRAEALAPASRL